MADIKKTNRRATEKPVVGLAKTTKSQSRKRTKVSSAPSLRASMATGRASPAKASDGDQPVFAYIRSLPEPQHGIAKRIDALAAETLPGLKRSIKWGIAWYGIGNGWCFCCGGFAGHVKLTFGRGTALKPVPPSTPVGMGKDSRGLDLKSLDDLDKRQAAAWMRQATAMPGFGRKKQ